MLLILPAGFWRVTPSGAKRQIVPLIGSDDLHDAKRLEN